MDVARIRAKIKELRTLADELEAALPEPVVAEVYEEDIVIVDTDFLADPVPATPKPSIFAQNSDFEREIGDAIARLLSA